MATTTVDATYQGIVLRDDQIASVNWSTTRNASTGDNAITHTTATTSLSIRSNLTSGRGDVVQRISRTFLFFDLDGIPDEAKGNITAATLKVLGAGTNNTAESIVVAGGAWGSDGSTSTLSTGDFDSLSFNKEYSSEKTSWSTAGYNDYTLNSNAIDNMNTVEVFTSYKGSVYYLNAAIIEFDYDYSNVAPADGIDDRNDVRFLDATNKIKLELTYEAGAGGYGNTVIGVAPANIGTVIGVAKADIGTVIGV